AGSEAGPQLTEFEERVWRRVLEAMRADVRRVEVALLERTDAVRAEQALAATEARGAASEAVTHAQDLCRGLEERVLRRLDGAMTSVVRSEDLAAAMAGVVRRDDLAATVATGVRPEDVVAVRAEIDLVRTRLGDVEEGIGDRIGDAVRDAE